MSALNSQQPLCSHRRANSFPRSVKRQSPFPNPPSFLSLSCASPSPSTLVLRTRTVLSKLRDRIPTNVRTCKGIACEVERVVRNRSSCIVFCEVEEEEVDQFRLKSRRVCVSGSPKEQELAIW